MEDELRQLLDECWVEDGTADDASHSHRCRYCGLSKRHGHDPSCPLIALSRALDQRDAIAEFTRSEKRSMTMQGAYRLAKKSDKVDVKRRLDEAMLRLEAARARLRELGIEEMVR